MVPVLVLVNFSKEEATRETPLMEQRLQEVLIEES